MFLFLDLLFVSCTYAFPNMDIVGYYSKPTQLINLILELEICLFRIKKNSILKYKCIVYSWHFIQIDWNYLEL